MYIDEVMTHNTQVVSSGSSVKEVANTMAQNQAGMIPVYEDDKLIGTVTDRDLVVGAIAKNMSVNDKILNVISEPVLYCFKDDLAIDVLENMNRNKVQRLVVLDNEHNKQLAGIVSVGDIASQCDDEHIARSIVECSRHYH